MKCFFTLLIVFSLNIAQEAKQDSSRIVMQRLPEIKVGALDGSKIILPDSAFGYITLIAFGFQRDSQDDMNTWIIPFAKEFNDSTIYNYYEIPMMGTRIPNILRGFINRGMKRGIAKDKHRKVLPYYGNIDKYAKELAMNDRTQVHIFLLDIEGMIRWQTQGPATEETMNELKTTVQELDKVEEQ